MAVGDDAAAAGYTLVPDTGEDGRVRWGAREINRTRDYVAQLSRRGPADTGSMQSRVGISYGTMTPPANYGSNGDIYFRII